MNRLMKVDEAMQKSCARIVARSLPTLTRKNVILNKLSWPQYVSKLLFITLAAPITIGITSTRF